MRKFLAIILILALTALACEVPTGVAETIMSEGNLVASKVAQALTETAGGGPAETLPSGGVPESTPTVDPGAPTPTQTLMPTAALPHLRVAFISGGSPWLVAPPAPAYALSASTGVDSVDISDDGQMVAYVRHNAFSEPGELRVVNYDGSGDRALLTSAQVGALEPVGDALFIDLFQVKWIPGTHNLLINTKAAYDGPGLPRLDDLFKVNAETGVLTAIFSPGNAGEVWPSPDGTKMVISRGSIPLAGQHRRDRPHPQRRHLPRDHYLQRIHSTIPRRSGPRIPPGSAWSSPRRIRWPPSPPARSGW